MKLFCRIFSLPIVFLCLLSCMTAGVGTAAAQSITFAPAEKPITIPAGNPPFGNIASDSSGNLFFSIDKRGNLTTLGKVSANGVFTTSTPLPTGDAIGYVKTDASGNLYVVDDTTNKVFRITPSGTQTVAATDSVFNFVDDFAVDGAGNLYVAVPPSKEVFKFTPAGVKTIFASGFAPGGIAVDGNANVYISDDTNNRIVKISPSGVQSVVKSGLNNPTNLVVDTGGNIYVVNFVLFNSSNSNLEDAAILRISPSGVATKIFDAFAFGRDIIQDVAVDGAGNVYAGLALTQSNFGNSIVEIQNATVAQGGVDFGGNFSALWYTEGGDTAVKVAQPITFTFHASVAVASVAVLTNGAKSQDFQSISGGTCVAQTYSSGQTCTVNVQFSPTQSGTREGAVVLLDSSGNPLSTVNLHGLGIQPAVALDPGVANALAVSGLKDPSAAAVDGLGNSYIADKGNDRVVKLSSSGVQTVVGSGFVSPTGVAVDGAGNLYVSDTGNDRIEKILTNGTQATILSGLNTPDGIAVDGLGSLYVADSGNNRVVKLAADGSTQTNIGTGYSRPTGVAVDGTGNVYVADFGNNQIVRVAPDGSQATLASGLSGPTGIAVDAGGDLYIAEVSTNQVVMLTQAKVQITIAGGLNFPFDAVLVATGSSGDVFIADTLNNRVLQVDRTHATMNFGSVAVGGVSSPRTVTYSEIGLFTNGSPFPTLSDSTDFSDEINQNADCGIGFVDRHCNVTITFTPKKKGTLTGTATMSDTPSQGTQVINLSGTGQ